jgi:septal ring factor EnvC (AmiA/AmiB activator)
VAITEERLKKLEVRVDVLETWAGPGHTEALADGQRLIRADLAKIHKTQDRHTRQLAHLTSDVAELRADVTQLKADVAELRADVTQLKADVTDIKGTLREILRRLPPEHG